MRDIIDTLPVDQQASEFRRGEAVEAARTAESIYEVVAPESTQQFDVHDLIDCVADKGSFQEYKEEYGKTVICGYARVGGFSVGIIANQHKTEMSKKDGMQFGGVIYHDSADKMARFIMDCNQTWTPLLFLQDVMGFMVGRDSEQAGIIRNGAKIVNAISNSRVPKITVITGGSYGAGNYALCGKAFDPRFIFAWPNAQYAVMGGKQAASTLLDINIAALKRQGQEPDTGELEELRQKVTEAYETTTDIRYGAARGWVDAIIEPAQTREKVIRCLELATRHASDEPFRTGVLQV